MGNVLRDRDGEGVFACFALTAQMVHHLKIDMFKRDFEMGQRFHVCQVGWGGGRTRGWRDIAYTRMYRVIASIRSYKW